MKRVVPGLNKSGGLRCALSPVCDRPLGVKSVRASRPEDSLGIAETSHPKHRKNTSPEEDRNVNLVNVYTVHSAEVQLVPNHDSQTLVAMEAGQIVTLQLRHARSAARSQKPRAFSSPPVRHHWLLCGTVSSPCCAYRDMAREDG